jgi:hypothetical protein
MSITSAFLRGKRQKNPSRRLTENNAAIPELSSHRDSVALAAAQRALATTEAQDPPPSTSSTTSPNCGRPNQDSGGLCLERAVLGVPQPSQESQPTAVTGSRSNSTALPHSSSDSDGSTRAIAEKKKKKQLKRKRAETTSGTEMDTDGMYKDIDVMEISSGDESGPELKNKRNPTADIDNFFDPARYTKGSKGDKQGRRQCRACA